MSAERLTAEDKARYNAKYGLPADACNCHHGSALYCPVHRYSGPHVQQRANPLLPCGHLFLGGTRCSGRPEWHDGAPGKHPYKPIDRRSGTDRRGVV